MAGVPITGGSGYTVAADIVGTPTAPTTGDRTQYFKLDGGTAGSSAPLENATAANLATVVGTKALMVGGIGQWAKTHAPAVNTAATISKAAVALTYHVCQWLTITLANDSTGSVQTVLTFNLRDGATGAGTILASFTLALPATAGECRTMTLGGLNLIGTVNTAMTLETASAPGTHTAASVAFGGFSAV